MIVLGINEANAVMEESMKHGTHTVIFVTSIAEPAGTCGTCRHEPEWLPTVPTRRGEYAGICHAKFMHHPDGMGIIRRCGGYLYENMDITDCPGWEPKQDKQ